jgi:hypothetical protein
MGEICSTHEKNEKCVRIPVRKREAKRENSQDTDIDGREILECILGKWVGNVWTGFIRVRIGTSGGLL